MPDEPETKITRGGTWLPLGLVVSVVIVAFSGAWLTRGSLADLAASNTALSNNIAALSTKFQHQLELMASDHKTSTAALKATLIARTASRWPTEAELDAWAEFIRNNPDADLTPPDIRAIKKNYEELP